MWKDIAARLNKTGRTTRMFEEARRLAEAGKDVEIVCSNPLERRRDFLAHVEQHSGWKPDYSKQAVRYEAASKDDRISYMSCVHFTGNTYDIDWETLEPRGYSHTTVLVDHYLIESKFRAMLEMLHRYDPPPT